MYQVHIKRVRLYNRVRRLYQARKNLQPPGPKTLKQYQVLEDLIEKSFEHPEIVKEIEELKSKGLMQ